MALKDILLLLDLGTTPSAAMDVAVDLAAKSSAHVTAISLVVDPVVTGFVVAPVPVDFIESARKDALVRAKVSTDRFEEAARLAGISREVRVNEVLMGGIPQGFVAAARMSDLVIIGQENPDHSEPLRDLLIETALYEGIAPVLVVPYIARAPLKMQKVLVAWDGSQPAARAIRDALPFLPEHADVTILMLGNATKQPGEPGADLATWLARHGVNVSLKSLPGAGIPVAAGILNHATDNGFDIVVMGAYGHSWMREAIFGGATRDILKTMTVPVLMAH
jgi:nucleotide-binding universal stress UspA family protein